MMDLRKIESAYSDARNRYAQFNVDTDEAIRKLDSIQPPPFSMVPRRSGVASPNSLS